LGNNFAGEHSPSYILSDACGVPEPTPMLDIGFNTSLVWVITNDTNPTVSHFGSQCPCVPNSCVGYCGVRPWCYTTTPCWCDSICQTRASQPCCSNVGSICLNITTSISPTIVGTNGHFTNPQYSPQPVGLNEGGVAAVTIVVIAVVGVVVVLIVLYVLYRKRRMFTRLKSENYEEELEEKDKNTTMEEVSL